MQHCVIRYYSWTAYFRMFVYGKTQRDASDKSEPPNARHQNKSELCHESVDANLHSQPLFLISRSKVTFRCSVTRFVFVANWGQLSVTRRPHLSFLIHSHTHTHTHTHTCRDSILNWVMTSSPHQLIVACATS